MSELQPPEGYVSVSLLRHPRLAIRTALFLPVSIFCLFFLPFSRNIFLLPGFQGTGIWEIIFMVSNYFLIHITRGLIQRWVSYRLGYAVSFELFPVISLYRKTYTAASRQLQSRSHALLIASTPISVFLLLLLVSQLIGIATLIGSFLTYFCLIHIPRTLQDIYSIWKLLRMPEKSVVFIENVFFTYILEPEMNG